MRGLIMKSMFKLLAIYVLRCVSRLFYIFPIKKNRLIFFSSHGLFYNCNPMYITEYLLSHKKNKYEIIWAFSQPEKYEFLKKKGVKVIKYNSVVRFYYEATSQASINNIGSFSWLPLRKGQLHINTWHGGGCYKTVSLGEKRNNKVMKKTLLLTARETSYMIASSQYSADYVYPNDFGYKGPVLNIGYPRNDILIKGNREVTRCKVCKYFQISPDTNLILFAPTWRYDREEKVLFPDFTEIAKAFTKRFEGKTKVLLRIHKRMYLALEEGDYLNASDYPDMQELLLACDMLLSDYSSCIWDFSLTYRPCILFTPDLEQYTEERGFDIDIHKWGFPIATTNEELIKLIEEFDEKKFVRAMHKHQEDLGSFDKGTACESFAKFLEEKLS